MRRYSATVGITSCEWCGLCSYPTKIGQRVGWQSQPEEHKRSESTATRRTRRFRGARGSWTQHSRFFNSSMCSACTAAAAKTAAKNTKTPAMDPVSDHSLQFSQGARCQRTVSWNLVICDWTLSWGGAKRQTVIGTPPHKFGVQVVSV